MCLLEIIRLVLVKTVKTSKGGHHSQINIYLVNISSFFNCYLATTRPTFTHYRRGSLTQPMLITTCSHTRPAGHQEPCNKVGSLSPAERLVEFELRNFQF